MEFTREQLETLSCALEDAMENTSNTEVYELYEELCEMIEKHLNYSKGE